MATSTTSYDTTGGVGQPAASTFGTAGLNPYDDDLTTLALKRISWGAVLAGVVVALVTQLILNMLGLGLGLAAVDPAEGGGTPDAGRSALTAAIWFAVTGLIASFLGGVVASRLSGRPDASTGGWHGLTSWALTTLVLAWLVANTLGGLLGGAFNLLGSTVGSLGRALGEAAPAVGRAVDEPADPLRQQLDQLTGVATNDPEAIRSQLADAVRRIATGGPEGQEAARQEATDLIARTANIPPEEARARIDELERNYRETAARAEQTARQTADVAAEGTSTTALAGAGALILGAIAAVLGGRAGTPRPNPRAVGYRDDGYAS